VPPCAPLYGLGDEELRPALESPAAEEVVMHRFLRQATVVAASAIAFVTPGISSIAASPNGGCGAAFTWATIGEIRELRPNMPPGVAESVDANGNGALCYQELLIPNYPSPKYGHLNLVDDRPPARDYGNELPAASSALMGTITY
jgi:hypothetical protein